MSIKKIIYLTLIFITAIQSQPIPDEAFMLQFIVYPEDFLCDSNHTMICDATGLACNVETGLCFPPCEEDADCLDYGEGTGLNKCVDGSCITDGKCTVSEDECAISLGFTCNTNTYKCEQPTGCTSNDACSTPGLGYCDTTLGTGICRQELCQKSEDCISTGYVCQNPPGFCVESCKTNDICAVEGSPLTCGDNGLCEIKGCTQDADCTGFTNTCLYNTSLPIPVEGVCITTCSTTYDCEDLGIPGTSCQDGYCIPEPPMEAVPCETDTECTEAGLDATCVVTPAGVGLCLPSCQDSLDCPDLYLTATICQDGFCIPDVYMPISCSTDTDCEVDSTCVAELGYCLPNCVTDSDCVESQFKCDTESGYCYPGCSNDQDCSDIPGTVCSEFPVLGYETCIFDDSIIPKSCGNDGDCGESGYKCNTFAKLCYPSCNVAQDCIDLGLNHPCKSQNFGIGPAKVTVKYCDITQSIPSVPTTSTSTTSVIVDTTIIITTEDSAENSVGDGVAMHALFGTFVWILMVMFNVW